MLGLQPDRICVCIIALTFEKCSSIELEGCLHSLESDQSTYDIHTEGKVYNKSPDDWCPFEEGHSISNYFSENRYNLISISNNIESWQNPPILDDIINKTTLFIIDPLTLLLDEQLSELISQLNTAIRASGTEFCLILPQRFPDNVKVIIEEKASNKLTLLKLAYRKEGRGEWLVNTPERFEAFLNNRRENLKKKFQKTNISQVGNILTNLGIEPNNLDHPPVLQG